MQSWDILELKYFKAPVISAQRDFIFTSKCGGEFNYLTLLKLQNDCF